MMSNESRMLKSGGSERRLRLRKASKERIDDKIQLSDSSNNEYKQNDIACTSKPVCDNDSILDFKSPKRAAELHTMQLGDINSKILVNKSKKKILRSKLKIMNERKLESIKPAQNEKIRHDIQQSSIDESPFYKTEEKVHSSQNSADVKTAYVCVLCLKNLKDENSQAIHMKSCAIKNNISTKKLLDAMELQERQAAERKSLGLLSAPILQNKKKVAPCKMTSQNDPDLQLALALSKSLYETEEIEMWGEAEIMAISSGPSLPESNKECSQKTTLQSFGFTTNRSISPTKNCSANKIKRRKHMKPTVLQKRTVIERERILTERIAEILMDDKDFTQKVQEEKEQYNNIKQKIILKNQFLQQLHQTENTLWHRTGLTSPQDLFYVKELSPYIIPVLKKEQKLNEKRNLMQHANQNVSDEELDKEQIWKTEGTQTVQITDNHKELTTFPNAMNVCCKEKKFLDILATNWGNILNDSSASDVIIFVKNNMHIWVHKLVFYVRCTNILLDIISNDTKFSAVKERICWPDIDYDVAMAFLEFIYCGIINKYSRTLDSKTSLSAIRFLARKYKVNDLFMYLRQFNLTVAKHDYNAEEKSIEDAYINMEKASNTLGINTELKSKLTLHISHHNESENIQCPQKILLQEDINNTLQSTEDCYLSIDEMRSCIVKNEKTISMNLSEKINNISTIQESSTSPDMFDTPDIVKHIDESMVYSGKNHEDSNIHMLLSLIKQDADICSQKSLIRRTQNAEYSESSRDISTCLQNMEQDIIKIDSDSDSNILKTSVDDLNKNLLLNTPQCSKPESTRDCPSKAIEQKGNLTLFIEKMQRANRKLDSNLDSDLDFTTRSIQISPIEHLNPFHINRHNNFDNEDSESRDDNIKQLIKTGKKLGKLSILEQQMQSCANKNSEFYFGKHVQKQTNTLHMTAASLEEKVKFSHDNTDYAQNFTLSGIKESMNISERATTPLSVHSLPTNTIDLSLSESICDTEIDEKDISMYSQYMKKHKDNSIAKYRTAIVKNRSDSNLSDKSASSDSVNNSDIDENKKPLAQSILTEKDTDIIISDTEIESISSSISCPIVLQNNRDDFHHENKMSHFSQQSRYLREDNKQYADNKRSNQSEITKYEVEEVPEIAKFIKINLEKEKDIENRIKTNRNKFDTDDIETLSDDIDVNTRINSELDGLYENKANGLKKEHALSPIMTFFNPDVLIMENSSSDVEQCNKDVKEKADSCKSRKSAKLSFNFEDDIYLANVDIDKYEKNVLEKSQSASVLNTMEFKKANEYKKKSYQQNSINNNAMTDNYENLDCNGIQNSTSIRKLKKKSLSEGQININVNRSHNSSKVSTMFKHVSAQFHSNYNKKIGNINTTFKTTDKDVTPPPDYNGMRTPELHREMKRYGLKAQKRSRAVKLLTHIYNELHPLIPLTEIMTREVTKVSSDEDEGPPLKKPNMDDDSLEKHGSKENSEDELFCFQNSNGMNSLKISKEMESYETKSLPKLESSSDVREAFMKLISIDKELHNKILRYEPINIKQLHSTLRAKHGFKRKLSNLMSFLDEQCITFYIPEQSVRSKARNKAEHA